MIMHGAQIVSEVKHRMHVTNHFQSEPWTVEVRGHIATICPTDNNRKWVYYRNYWFRVVVDELIITHVDTQGKLDKRFDDAMREAIEKYIDENHIVFGDEKIMNKNAKVKYKFRVGDYFRQGMPYELILTQGSALYNKLTCNGSGPAFTNECCDGSDKFRTTIICDGFDTDDTRAIFIYYDAKEKKPMRFALNADVLVRSIGLQDDGTIEESSRDDHICITRIPIASYEGVPTEDCFGSVYAHVPSFMLEHVLQKAE